MVHPDAYIRRPAFPISGAILLSKANDFTEMYGYDREIRPRWIDRWKVRHDISFKPFHEEVPSVDLTVSGQKLSSSYSFCIST